MATRRLCEDVLTIMAMVAMECADVGLKTLYKAATLKGMSCYVFIVYSHAVAALLLLPFPFLSHRSSVLSPLGFSTFCKIGLLGLIGSASQILGYTGINYSSPTLSSAMSNLIPAFTFIFAVIFGMEKVALKRASSTAKVLGTIGSITGAFIVTLYKGPPIIRASPQSISLHQSLHESSNSYWSVGGAFLAAESILIPLCYIVLKQIMNEYPSELTVNFFFNLSVSLMVTIGAVITGTDAKAWRIKPDITLASVICSGLIRSCMYTLIHTWALHLKGPLFVAMYKPLSIVIAVAMGVMFLHDSLYLGSLIGAIIISTGFYAVMWGKAKEKGAEKNIGDGCESSATAQNVPLLKSCKNENV